MQAACCHHSHHIRTNSRPRGRLVNSMLRLDPTRTLTLRRAFEAALVRRFQDIKRVIKKSIVDRDCFGLQPRLHQVTALRHPTSTAEQAYAFMTSGQKVASFMAWLQEQVDAGILEIFTGQQLGTAIDTAWTNTYIKTAYQKGMQHADAQLKKAGHAIPEGWSDDLEALFRQPAHADRAGLIFTRTFTDLQGITAEMDKQISRILADGIAKGDNPREIAKALADRVDKIGITRARLLAQTEVIHAHAEATLQEYANWGLEGVSVEAEWVTSGLGTVCELCKSLQGKSFTIEEARGMIPRHPRCKCAWIPRDVTEEQS